MEDFKKRWEITKNWQLFFPLVGLLGLFYSSYKIVSVLKSELHVALKLTISILITSILLKLTLLIFKKLEKKWVVKQRWEIIRIFIVF